MMHLSDEEFTRLKMEYQKLNNSFSKKLIFHVGTQAGFYSEVVSVMECMCWCYLNEVRFMLYADDANFCQNGWNDIFESFCEENHDPLNKVANYRSEPRFQMQIKPLRYWFSYKVRSRILKRKNHVDYITSDVFSEVISKDLKNTYIKWDTFNMDGKVYPEISKLFPFATRFNAAIRTEVDKLKNSLHLPDEYVSIQIRGGDKIIETELISAEECLSKIMKSGIAVKDLFIFTDDFRNIEYFQHHTDWRIYYLTKKEEKGYVNSKFQQLEWEEKRKNLIKLFAMVDICIDSKIHFGYEKASSNNYIKVCKEKGAYYSLSIG